MKEILRWTIISITVVGCIVFSPAILGIALLLGCLVGTFGTLAYLICLVEWAFGKEEEWDFVKYGWPFPLLLAISAGAMCGMNTLMEMMS